MLVWRFTTHHSPLIPHMQYFLSKEAMRCPDKVTALHLLTHRIVFANAPHCVFSLTAHLPVMLNSFLHLTRAFLVLLRGQILKFAVKREQRHACLNFAEREQIEQR